MMDVTVRSANIHDNYSPAVDVPGAGTSLHARGNLTLAKTVVRRSGNVLVERVGQNTDDAQTWQRVIADVVNVGPSAAELDPARPIRVTFRPAAGVAAEGSLDAQIDFALQPGTSAAGLSFELTPTGSSWPSVLGTFELDPGPNQLAGSGTIPLAGPTWRYASSAAPVCSHPARRRRCASP